LPFAEIGVTVAEMFVDSGVVLVVVLAAVFALEVGVAVAVAVVLAVAVFVAAVAELGSPVSIFLLLLLAKLPCVKSENCKPSFLGFGSS
jgi:hypothetical protein